ncbi:DUF5988 family protein [Nonomuraea sediminis]|uniref:DUF5988 family protein n=1 Tax=Nonomuraea sediminis TaxID=2835864 RepID=UPI001BDD69C0|nr:DUF5988 family protein [Nonomuraea sediminis]
MASSQKAFLVGGPADLPGRIVPITPPGVELKIPHRGGYEHFRLTSRHEETEEGRLPIYEWFERTAIAE